MRTQKASKSDIFLAVGYTITLVLSAIPASFLGMKALNFLLAAF
jgi:hypothetical protein